MAGQILDGRAVAARLRGEVAEGVARFRQTYGRPPGLDVVLVGDDEASQIYVRNKEKAAADVGMRGRVHRLAATTSKSELIAFIDRLNQEEEVDGFLVQLPLPQGIDDPSILDRVSPDKDVDGLHPMNAGLLALGRSRLVSATPRGVMRLIAHTGIDCVGRRAIVIGRSNIVGKPLAQLLLSAHATVTIAHSRTRDLADLCRQADVLVAAVGRAELVRGDWVKPGAVVIDVGTNRNDQGKLVGDVAFAEVVERAAWITPVPGGVGPMTIACLLENALRAALDRKKNRDQGRG